MGDGASADEPMGHGLAALDARWIFLAASAVAGHEERLLESSRRSSTSCPPGRRPSPGQEANDPAGDALRVDGPHRWPTPARRYLEIANDSPYPIRLACLLEAPAGAAVEDLGRGYRLAPAAESGGRNLVLDLLPYGVSAIRIGAPDARVVSLTEYPSDAVLAEMQARSNELSTRLAHLNQNPSEAAVEPANAGFEPVGEASRGPAPTPVAHEPGAEDLPPLPGPPDPAVTTAGGAGPGPDERRAPAPRGWRLEPGRSGRRPPRASRAADAPVPIAHRSRVAPHRPRQPAAIGPVSARPRSSAIPSAPEPPNT